MFESSGGKRNDDGKIVRREKRDKMGHGQFSREAHERRGQGGDPRGHGFDPAAQGRHIRMAVGIGDCQFLLRGGMGSGAYESIRQASAPW